MHTTKERLLVAFFLLLAMIGQINDWFFGIKLFGIPAQRLSDFSYVPLIAMVVVLLARSSREELQ